MSRRATVLLPLLLAVSASSLASSTTPFRPVSQKPSSPGPAACSFAAAQLPADTVVVAAGGYSGRPLAFQIDQSGHQASQYDVRVHSDKPVALLLGAYEPTVWSLSWSAGTKIVAVFATGYHRQAVAGLPKEVPVITTSFEGKGPCGGNYFGHRPLTWVNPKAREVFGRPAIRIYQPNHGLAFDIVESTRAKSAYVSAPATPPESFHDKKAPLAGTTGLEDAVTKGQLRRMTAADLESVQKFYQAQSAEKGSTDIPPIAGATDTAPPRNWQYLLPTPLLDPGLRRSFVVLKPFTYPAGLYGANQAHFIVPKGVPVPTGNRGHSTVIDLNKPTPLVVVGR